MTSLQWVYGQLFSREKFWAKTWRSPKTSCLVLKNCNSNTKVAFSTTTFEDFPVVLHWVYSGIPLTYRAFQRPGNPTHHTPPGSFWKGCCGNLAGHLPFSWWILQLDYTGGRCVGIICMYTVVTVYMWNCINAISIKHIPCKIIFFANGDTVWHAQYIAPYMSGLCLAQGSRSTIVQ